MKPYISTILTISILAASGPLVVPATAREDAKPYFAGMFAQGCDSVARCVDEAQQLARSVCAKLNYRHVASPTRTEEVLVIVGGGAQGSFTWQAPVNCTDQPVAGTQPSG